MRVLMTGGGTAGHVNPALAIANTIKENDPSSEIAFVGTDRGIENKLVTKAGYELFHVNVMGLSRKLTLKNIKAAYLALTSPIKAKKIIKSFNPDIVIGTGGYVSWPVVKAAASMGIPTALHESNAVPGMAVRMLSGAVNRIYLNFEVAGAGIAQKDKLLLCGCPLLTPPENITKEEAKKQLGIPENAIYVLSYGGSMGAEKVNEAVLEVMKNVTGAKDGIKHTHATGAIEKDICFAKAAELGFDKVNNVELVEYIYDMPIRLAAADVVICRAGAMTVSELAMAGKCAVFIPSPNVTDDQQFKNASVLSVEHAAYVLRENESMPQRLCEIVSELIDNADKRAEMENKIKRFAKADANKVIYNDILKLIEK